MGEKPEPQEKTMRMAQLVQSAGIDCGKRFLYVAVYPGGEQIGSVEVSCQILSGDTDQP